MSDQNETKELPESIQAAIGYMQQTIMLLEGGGKLTPRQRHLIATASALADEADKEEEYATNQENQ